MEGDGEVEEAELTDAGIGVDVPGALADGLDMNIYVCRGNMAVIFEELARGGGDVGIFNSGLIVQDVLFRGVGGGVGYC